MKNILRNLFTFNAPEKNGMLFFVFIIIVFIVANLIISHTVDSKTIDYKTFTDEVDTFENRLKAANAPQDVELFAFNPNTTDSITFLKLGLSSRQAHTVLNYRNKGGKFYDKEGFKKIYGISEDLYHQLEPYIVIQKSEKKYESKEIKGELFDFDPNKMSLEQWKRLGMSEKQIRMIENYCSKGGKFYKKEDFAKMYCINAQLYEKLAPYIKIEVPAKKIVEEKTVINKEVFELNSVSVEQLAQIKGLNQKTAERIVKYRTLLGGFESVSQLLEVYGFSQNTYNQCFANFKTDKSKVKRLNINFADFKELCKHPYIGYENTKSIVNFRTKNGSYKDINDLKDKKVIDNEAFEKMKNYICTQ